MRIVEQVIAHIFGSVNFRNSPEQLLKHQINTFLIFMEWLIIGVKPVADELAHFDHGQQAEGDRCHGQPFTKG